MNHFIQYTSRTFNTVLNDINSHPELVDKNDWFKKLIAGAVDVLSMMINATANNAYLRTCFTKQALFDICERMGYKIPPHTTATGKMFFYFKATATPQTVARADLTAIYNGLRFSAQTQVAFPAEQAAVSIVDNKLNIPARTTGEKVRFSHFNPDTDYFLIAAAADCRVAGSLKDALLGTAVTIPAGTDTVKFLSVEVAMLQGVYKEVALGKVDGADFPEVYLPDKDILMDTVTVLVNGDDYSRVDSLLFSAPTDEHFQFIRKADGKTALLFGNNVYGKNPLNAEITAAYYYGGGAQSNVHTVNTIVNYSGGAAAIEGCANSTPFTGGSDEKDIETIRLLAPGALQTHDRFVTVADGENLAASFGGIALAKVLPNKHGILSAEVRCIATGGGNPSEQVQADLQTYLTARTVLNSIAVSVANADIVTQTVTLTARIKANYNADSIQHAITLGLHLFFSETCSEITRAYNSAGAATAIEKLHSILGLDTPNALIPTLEKFFEYLNEFGCRSFGETIHESQLITFLTIAIQGIEYLTITAPRFPIILTETQICGVNAVSVGIIS
jgi:hypothetical protein